MSMQPHGYISSAPISEGGYYVSGGATGFPRPEYNSHGTSVDGLDGGFWQPQQRSQGYIRGAEKEKPGKSRKQGQEATDKKKEGKGSTLTREPPNTELRVAIIWALYSEIQSGYRASVLAPEAAYTRVKNAWMKTGIWNRKWGLPRGICYKHEQPLEEMLREELGYDVGPV
ncbi:unnamed protein product [Clonostachys byssicola]|uniref:Uncharacterized protein n=1 Tax=Clonostachys byssicola TaxID=160290 RepID=A0A9N9U833_9HYPO|nr:unnamed protein product [Clonostachys byssicola]